MSFVWSEGQGEHSEPVDDADQGLLTNSRSGFLSSHSSALPNRRPGSVSGLGTAWSLDAGSRVRDPEPRRLPSLAVTGLGRHLPDGTPRYRLLPMSIFLGTACLEYGYNRPRQPEATRRRGTRAGLFFARVLPRANWFGRRPLPAV